MKEGVAVILGGQSYYFDIKGSGFYYDPKCYLINLAMAEMMAHYQLPHYGTSGGVWGRMAGKRLHKGG